MGLACHKPFDPADDYQVIYHAPQPRAVLQVVDPDRPDRLAAYGAWGRVKLTTLTKEFFVPGFLERDEAIRTPPDPALSLGRRGRRPPLPQAGSQRGRGRLLMIDVPILRAGRPYLSKETLTLGDYATGEPVARVSQANPGLISRDLLADAWSPWQALPMDDILRRLRAAAGLFLRAELARRRGIRSRPSNSWPCSRPPRACHTRSAGRTWARSPPRWPAWRRSSTG